MGDWESSALADPPLDFHWVTDRLAVGGAIWTRRNMQILASAGITHVVDMQCEFDDREIADGTGIRVLWNPCDDDLEEKDVELLRRGVEFAADACRDPEARVYFHCTAGIHRGPMMLLAFLAAQGLDLPQALDLIRSKRPFADFPDVYRRSVARFADDLKLRPIAACAPDDGGAQPPAGRRKAGKRRAGTP